MAFISGESSPSSDCTEHCGCRFHKEASTRMRAIPEAAVVVASSNETIATKPAEENVKILISTARCETTNPRLRSRGPHQRRWATRVQIEPVAKASSMCSSMKRSSLVKTQGRPLPEHDKVTSAIPKG